MNTPPHDEIHPKVLAWTKENHPEMLQPRLDEARPPTKEELAAMLRQYPTWGHAAVAFKDMLADVESSLLAYWTDLPESEVQRLTVEIRAVLAEQEKETGSDFPSEPGAGDAAQAGDARPGVEQESRPRNMSDPHGEKCADPHSQEFSDEALERIAAELRCEAISANNEFVVCQRRLGHPLNRREAHVGVDLEGVTYEFRQVLAEQEKEQP